MDYIELYCSSLSHDEASVFMVDLADIGFDSFIEVEKGFKGYILKSIFESKEKEINLLLSHYLEPENYSLQFIKGQNWNSEWEKNFEPISVDTRCYVRASFHEKKPEYTYEIVITPKMSFGTGHHATTFLMMNEMLDMNVFNGKQILDMGCGTGILAMLASKMRASTILAIDIDDWAYENTKENLHINNITNVNVDKGDARILASQTFDVILANINRNVLLDDMHIYAACLNKGGDILFSGFYKDDSQLLMDRAKLFGLTFVHQNSKDNWALLHLKKIE